MRIFSFHSENKALKNLIIVTVAANIQYTYLVITILQNSFPRKWPQKHATDCYIIFVITIVSTVASRSLLFPFQMKQTLVCLF